MIDTTALFGSAASEPAPSAGEPFVDRGFMATLGDVLAGMLDPEGLRLVQAIAGHSGSRDGDGAETGDGAPNRHRVDAPEIEASRLAAALRFATPTAAASAANVPGPGPQQNGVPAATELPSAGGAVSKGLGLRDPDGDRSHVPATMTHDGASPGAGDASTSTAAGGGPASGPGMGKPVAAGNGRVGAAPGSSFDAAAAASTDGAGPIPADAPSETAAGARGGRLGSEGIPAPRQGQPAALDATAHRSAPDRQLEDLAAVNGSGRDGAAPPIREAASPVPASPASPARVATAPLVERLVRAIEHIQNQPPPRSLMVEIPEFDGLRIRVAVRHDGAIHLAIPGDRAGDLALPILDAARAALTERGFDMAHDSPDRRRPRDRDDSDLPREQRRNRAAEPRGLRI